MIVFMPLINSGREDVGFRKIGLSFVFEEIIKKWKLDVLAIKNTRLGAELRASKRFAVASRPASVTPRTHHKNVEDVRVVFLNGLVNVQSSIEIFGVEPTSDRHHGRRHASKMPRHVPRLPVGIVIAVLHPFIPKSDIAVQEFLICVCKRPHFEKEVVAILRSMVEAEAPHSGGTSARSSESRDKIEPVRQEESSVVVQVVSQPVVTHRGLR